MFQLTRTLPDGTVRVHTPVNRVRDATRAAGFALHLSYGVPKAEAQQFSKTLERTPVGETIGHEGSGVLFRIDVVDAPPEA